MNKMTRELLMTVAVLLTVAACTRMPVQYSDESARSSTSSLLTSGADLELMALVSTARIGASMTHVDARTGLASGVRVNSEYFSANGRHCRRFTQHLSIAAKPVNKLACEARDGWQEIPVASIVE